MGAVAAIKSFVVSDDVATLEARSASCAAELAFVGEAQIVHERALLEAEKHGDIKAGDAAVLKLEAASKQVDRLRVRRSAIAEALTTAKVSKSAAEKSVRVEAYRLEAERAHLAADSAEKVCIAAVISLAEAITTYGTQGRAEREAVAGIAREGGGTVGCARRSVGIIEQAALKQVQSLSTYEVCIPVLK